MAGEEYIFDPIVTDPDQLQQDAFDYIQAQWPDWVPHDSNLEAWLIAACARMVAEARDLASDVPSAIFKYLGATVYGIAPIDATAATVDSTWTFGTNPSNRTIEAGTEVGIPDSAGVMQIFEVIDEVTIASPTLTTAAGQVHLRSQDPGTQSDEIGEVGMVVFPVEAIAWVDTIELVSATSGGTDEESDDAYLDRLSRRLTRREGGIVLPRDFASAAVDIAAENGVSAVALPLDLYDPDTDTWDNERTVSVVVRDVETGASLSGPVKTAIDENLQADREVNFIVNVLDPDGPTSIDITLVGKSVSGYDPATVEDLVTEALDGFLATSNWGFDPFQETRVWVNATKVRFQDVSAVANTTTGFDYWTTLEIAITGDPLGIADVDLPGVAPVTAPGTIDVTVTAP
jgi:hypothetical protein